MDQYVSYIFDYIASELTLAFTNGFVSYITFGFVFVFVIRILKYLLSSVKV